MEALNVVERDIVVPLLENVLDDVCCSTLGVVVKDELRVRLGVAGADVDDDTVHDGEDCVVVTDLELSDVVDTECVVERVLESERDVDGDTVDDRE